MKTIAQQLGIKEFPFRIKDKNGNKIYSENPDGTWIKREFDSNGNVIYYETSSGYWMIWEWDSNGNKIYSENLDGYWEKIEYDSNGNRIYFENSKGNVVDNRPKSSCEGKIVEIDGKKYKLTEV